MAVDTKTTGLSSLAANPADTDRFMVVDVSDTTMAPTGTNKYLEASYVSFRTNTETLTNKTLTAPVIGDFTNAVHTHTNTAGGGQLDHGLALTGLGDDDHTQYLLATGTRTGASSQAQTFTNGIVGPSWKPTSNSTTAIQIDNAAGTAIVNVDTTNSRVGIGTTAPIASLHIIQSGTAAFIVGNGETDATTKVGRMGVQHYTNAEEPLLVVGGASTSTSNNIDFGGGSGVMNTATQITFYTATTNTTLTGTQRLRIDSNGLMAVGNVTPAAHVHIAGDLTASAWSTNGIAFRNAAATFTDSSTASSGTATNAVASAFGTPTFAASNTTVTMTNAATVYIANAPTAGTNVTLTNAYALWIDDGVARFDGQIRGTAGTTSSAPLRIPHGSAPTSPVDGDVWTTTAGLYVRINGVTVGPLT